MEQPRQEYDTTHPAAVPALGPQLLKFSLELGPILVFFVTNMLAGFFWGTGVFMAVTVVALLLSWMLLRRIPVMPLVSGVFILLFGALTLVFEDEFFMKVKPTVLNLLFAATLFVGLSLNKLFLKLIFGELFRLKDEGWRVLTMRWAFFFLFLAGLNEFVWRTYSTETWIAFKGAGIFPMTMLFALAQIGLLARYELKPQDVN